MSRRQQLLVPNLSVSSGAEAVAFTLTLDDLSTRFAEYNGAAASIKFKLTTTDGGGSKTTASFVYLDASQGTGNAAGSLDAIGDVATLIQTQLNALAGYSGVTVNGVATVPGDQWDFTITFPGALGVTDLDFHASSQWYPTITLVETVITEGASFVPGVNEAVEIGASGADDTTSDSNGNSVTLDGDGNYSYATNGTGWTTTVSANPASFSADSAGARNSTLSSGNGYVNVTQAGSDEVPGANEVVSLSAEPVPPTGGTWKPYGANAAIDWDATEGVIASQIGTSWDGSDGGPAEPTVIGSIHNSSPQITAANTGDVGALGSVNIDLTAPEVTHSITPV